jgi:hypothetical protein
MPKSESYEQAIIGKSVEVQDQLMRLPKLVAAAKHCGAEFYEMAVALHQFHRAFMEFEREAQDHIENERTFL